MKSSVWRLAWTLSWCILAATVSRGDENKPANVSELEKQVVQLIRQLDSLERNERDRAEEELAKLGPNILPLLPEVTSPELSAEQRRRLRRLLPDLWKERLMESVGGSTVTLSAESLKLAEALTELRSQTGNPINDMRPDFNQPAGNPELRFDSKTGKFWQVLDDVVGQASLGYYHFTENRAVGLQAQQGPGGPVYYSGAFRFELQRLMLDHRFDQREEPSCGITIGVFMEPKIRPIMIVLEQARCSAVDDQGNSLTFEGPQQIPLAVEKTAYHLPISLRLNAPPRSATKLTKLQGELSVWLPAHTQEFVFDGLEQGKPVTRGTSSLRVSLQRITDDEGLWTVPVILEQLLEVGQVDSYLQAALENEIFLRNKSDGSRFNQNGGLSTFGEEPGKMGVEYLFVDAPGDLKDYELVLRVPTGLTEIPVQFSFENIALP